MSYQVEEHRICHLCGRPLIDGICLSCDRPHRRSVAAVRARLRARDNRPVAIAGAVLVSLLVTFLFVVLRRSGGAAPAVAVPPSTRTVSTSALPAGVLSPSVFGVATGTMDEFGRRDLRGFAFVVRSSNHVTNLLTDYYVVVDTYLLGQRTVDLQQGDRTYTAEITAVSPDPHVALLRLNGTWDAMPISSDQLAPGDPVDVYTSGAKRRAAVISYSGRGGSVHLTFSVGVADRGSGAPVLDVNGRVVGIAESTSQFGPAATGVGFAEPIAQMCAAVAAC